MHKDVNVLRSIFFLQTYAIRELQMEQNIFTSYKLTSGLILHFCVHYIAVVFHWCILQITLQHGNVYSPLLKFPEGSWNPLQKQHFLQIPDYMFIEESSLPQNSLYPIFQLSLQCDANRHQDHTEENQVFYQEPCHQIQKYTKCRHY